MNKDNGTKLTRISPVDKEAIEKVSQSKENYSISIIINGREYRLFVNELSYDDILAFTDFSSDRHVTVQYTGGSGKKHSGTVLPNQSISITDGMVIDAVPTGVS